MDSTTKQVVKVTEEWRPVYGYKGYYEVSNFGQVRNSRTGRILKPRPKYSRRDAERHGQQYWTVMLYKIPGVGKNKQIHRLVCRAFHGPAPKRNDEVSHKDDDRSNNRADNLEWVSHRVNLDLHPDTCFCPYCRNTTTVEEIFGEE